MGYTMKHGNSAVPFKELGSSPETPTKFLDLTKKTRDKLMMAHTSGLVGDESKGTDADSMKKKIGF